MHEAISAILTISRWEVKRSLTTMGRNVLPLAALLFVFLILATGFAQQRGVHLQDGMYAMVTDSPDLAAVIAEDPHFQVTLDSADALRTGGGSVDLVVAGGRIAAADTDRGRAALAAFARDYARYETWVYTTQEDLFAAYPLWIDEIPVKSELDFLATQQGQAVGAVPRRGTPPVPEGSVEAVATPRPPSTSPPTTCAASSSPVPPRTRRYPGMRTCSPVIPPTSPSRPPRSSPRRCPLTPSSSSSCSSSPSTSPPSFS